MTHICVGKLTIIGSDNGLSPGRRQAIIWTNAGLLSIGPLRTYFSENLIKIQQFSLEKIHVKMSSAKWRLSCLGLNVLNDITYYHCTQGAIWCSRWISTCVSNIRQIQHHWLFIHFLLDTDRYESHNFMLNNYTDDNTLCRALITRITHRTSASPCFDTQSVYIHVEGVGNSDFTCVLWCNSLP